MEDKPNCRKVVDTGKRSVLRVFKILNAAVNVNTVAAGLRANSPT
jgi:hypothetical protein